MHAYINIYPVVLKMVLSSEQEAESTWAGGVAKGTTRNPFVDKCYKKTILLQLYTELVKAGKKVCLSLRAGPCSYNHGMWVEQLVAVIVSLTPSLSRCCCA